MGNAVHNLYEQHQTERGHGWYDGDANWRAQMREIYPVAYVSAVHRQEITDEILRLRADRLREFHGRVMKRMRNP